MEESVFDRIFREAEEKDNVKQISYEQFKKLYDSGENFFLLDVLPPESYMNGHIKGAISVPVSTINEQCMSEMLHSDSKVVVYCASYDCTASTEAGNKLKALGIMNVLDFKGGLKEWRKQGNELIRTGKKE
jgi:rhodanese-related sulfurtransferase